MPLGKSLNTILDDYFGEDNSPIGQNKSNPKTTLVKNIKISQIKISSYQTRRFFDPKKIEKLAKNIQKQGLIQPILVLQKKLTDSTTPEYILLAGERRLRAVKLLNQTEILAVIKKEEGLEEREQAMLSAMENLQREDLNPIELGQTFRMLILTQSITEEELAEMLGNSVQYVKNYLRLLTLDLKVQEAIIKNQITESKARFLTGLDAELQFIVLQEIIQKDLTVKEIQEFIKNIKEPKTKAEKPKLKSFIHSKATEILPKIEKISKYFPNAKMHCVGDEEEGKIVIKWKK
jgi:ParB family chromosome partitioning protein